jgi:hypothetical protein
MFLGAIIGGRSYFLRSIGSSDKIATTSRTRSVITLPAKKPPISAIAKAITGTQKGNVDASAEGSWGSATAVIYRDQLSNVCMTHDTKLSVMTITAKM